MSQNFIRIFFILITAIFSYYKLSNTKPANKLIQVVLLIISIITCLINIFLFKTNQTFNLMITFTVFLLTMKSFEKQSLSQTYITVLFSYAFSFIVFSFSIIVVSLALSPIYYQNYEVPWFIMRILIGIIQILIIYCCFHIPRLRKGLSFLYNLPSGNIGFTLCITVIMLIITDSQVETKTDSLFLAFFGFILISGFLLIYWWNYHITQTYRKYLKKNEIDSLNLLLEERNQEITYLRSENDKLARIIHKDNKLIPALSMAIIESYENGTELNLSALDCDSSLHMKLKQLYEERVEILAAYEKGRIQLPETSFPSVNAILSFTQTEAIKQNISYQVMLFDDLTSTIPTKITEKDFTHMLSDLLANSLNACKDNDSSFIQIYLGIIDEISTIKIYNNGNAFNIDTLKNLGLAKHTTHASTGGSGIGLMDIWMLKEKYKATLLIDEITDESSSAAYTCINILFNHKNHYIIQSDRHKELSTYINRPDIIILSKE